jgi:hypothetical protein
MKNGRTTITPKLAGVRKRDLMILKKFERQNRRENREKVQKNRNYIYGITFRGKYEITSKRNIYIYIYIYMKSVLDGLNFILGLNTFFNSYTLPCYQILRLNYQKIKSLYAITLNLSH